MRAIINGLRYDTEKANCIGVGGTPDGGNTSDWHSWTAWLYRTPRSGRFFLHGKGGALTQFGHGTLGQGGRWGGEKIVPLTPKDARDWAEQYLTADEVEKGFAEAIEDA